MAGLPCSPQLALGGGWGQWGALGAVGRCWGSRLGAAGGPRLGATAPGLGKHEAVPGTWEEARPPAASQLFVESAAGGEGTPREGLGSG